MVGEDSFGAAGLGGDEPDGGLDHVVVL